MSTNQLRLYNAALMLCGETTLVSLDEDREAARVLNEIWANNAIQTCLESGQWNFGIRSTRLDFDASLSAQFGYKKVFRVPDDWVRWTNICADEYFSDGFEGYQTENNYIFSDQEVLYVRYVSNGEEYGLDMSLWPQTFCRYVEAYLAFYASIQINMSDNKQLKLQAWMKKSLENAQAKDVQQEPERQRPSGNWVRSRRNYRRNGDY